MRFLLATCLVSFLAGCATTFPIATTDRTPAAIATLDLGEGPNENTVGTLEVQHLAQPSALRGDLTVYVVWVRPIDSAEWMNVGQFLVGEDRSGSFDLRVPHKQFGVLVSAEASGTVQSRSEFVVLEGSVAL